MAKKKRQINVKQGRLPKCNAIERQKIKSQRVKALKIRKQKKKIYMRMKRLE